MDKDDPKEWRGLSKGRVGRDVSGKLFRDCLFQFLVLHMDYHGILCNYRG